MGLLTGNTPLLWQDLVKHAEDRCAITLQEELEAYLVTLLSRYTNRPEVAKQIFATAFLEALSLSESQRHVSLQHVGDQCLLFAGLFPRVAQKRLVRVSYFVDLGRSAYAAISNKTNDIYDLLALQFVVLMDVLQSLREPPHPLMPIEAYEQWQEIGSKRALKILQEYSSITQFRKNRNH